VGLKKLEFGGFIMKSLSAGGLKVHVPGLALDFLILGLLDSSGAWEGAFGKAGRIDSSQLPPHHTRNRIPQRQLELWFS
jgi:hypothetical protein